MKSRTNSLVKQLVSPLAYLDKHPRLAWAVAAVWVVLITWLVAWFRLGAIGLIDETEPLFAEAARQMTVTGDWITPYFNGNTRFDKPPLVYWLMAIAYKTVGVNEWSARFPSALAITVLTAMGFYTLRRFGFPRPAQSTPDPDRTLESSTELRTESFDQSKIPPEIPDRAINPKSKILSGMPDRAINPKSKIDSSLWLSAFIGSAAIALNPQTVLWSRTGVSDMLLSGCMGAALLSFFCGYAQPEKPIAQSRWYLAFYIFTALAVLTKGPIGIVLPGLIILAFLAWVGNLRSVLGEMRLLRGSLIFLLITLPWYILVIWINGESYINSFFGYHNLERFTSVVNNHSAPWFFYFIVVPLSFLPWSVHLPVAIARLRVWKRRVWQHQPRSSHLGLFALTWFGVIFVFFTIAVTKLPSYTIPLLPAAGILVGLFWSDQMTRSRPSRTAWISHSVNVILFAGLAFAAFYSPNWLGNDPEMPDLPSLIRQSGIVTATVLVWLVAAVWGFVLLWRRQGNWLWSVNLIGFGAFIWVSMVPGAVIADAQRQLPLRELSETIVQVQQPNEPIVMIGFSKPSLVFYTERPVTYFQDVDKVPRDLRRFARQRSEAASLLLLGRSVKIREAGLPPESYEIVDESGIYQLLRMPMEQARTVQRIDSGNEDEDSAEGR